VKSELTEAVREATRDEFELAAELGGGEEWAVFLGRSLDGGGLAILLLQEAEDGDGQFDLEVIEAVEAGMPVGRTTCGACGAGEGGWPRFCAACGADLSGVRPDAAVPGESAGELLQEVRDAADGVYQVLGAMPHAEGGGALYFAREAATGRIVGLTLQEEAGGELALAVSWTPEPEAAAAPRADEVLVAAYPREEAVPTAAVPEPAAPPPPLWDPPAPRSRPRSRERTRRVAGVAAVAAVGTALVIALVLAVSGRSPSTAPPVATNLVAGASAAETDTASAPATSPETPGGTDPAVPAVTPLPLPDPPRREPPPATSAGSPPPAQLAVQTAPADPASADPAAEPPAAPTADGVEAAVRRYAQAVGSCQTPRIRQAYPGITSAEVDRWTSFFAQNCRGGLRAAYEKERDTRIDGTRAELVFTLTLSYTDATGNPMQLPLPMRALLEWTQGAWSLREVRSLAGR
jgi:hypothetical protein